MASDLPFLLSIIFRTETLRANQFAYSGAFSLTIDNYSFLLTIGAFLLVALAFLLTVGAFFAYNGKVRLIRALRDCEQRSFTVSKRTLSVSKKASPNFYLCRFSSCNKRGFSSGVHERVVSKRMVWADVPRCQKPE